MQTMRYADRSFPTDSAAKHGKIRQLRKLPEGNYKHVSQGRKSKIQWHCILTEQAFELPYNASRLVRELSTYYLKKCTFKQATVNNN